METIGQNGSPTRGVPFINKHNLEVYVARHDVKGDCEGCRLAPAGLENCTKGPDCMDVAGIEESAIFVKVED